MSALARCATVLAAAALVLNGCGGLTSQTEPPQSPLASGSSEPSPTLGSEQPSGQPSATVSPTAIEPSQSPTHAPPATDTPTPTNNELGTWRSVADFPPAGATVSSIVAAATGFVAVGSVSTELDDCDDLPDGRIWSSPDGARWLEASAEGLADTEMQVVVNAAGTLYAFGKRGSWDCPGGISIWRSSDGEAWEDLPAAQSFSSSAGINDVTVVADTIVAIGYVDDEAGERFSRAWTSTDGVDWDPADNSPGDDPSLYGESWLYEVASVRDVVVAFDEYAARPVWYSTDRGRSWTNSPFGPLFDVRSLNAAGGAGGFVVVGTACCGLPNTDVGVALTSIDGVSWTFSDPPAFRRLAEHVVALPNGLLAVGEQTRLSSDGIAWHVGPALPDFDSDDGVATAASSTAVLVVTSAGTWLASIDDLAIERWPDRPRAAEDTELGVRYPTKLFTHCGIPPIHFGLRTWLPDRDLGDNPPAGFAEDDIGWLTQITAERAEYTSRQGGSVELHAADQPQEPSFCA